MESREKTIKLLEAFLSNKEVDGVCGYTVVPDDGEDTIQVIVVLDIDYIKKANTKPGFVARMIREGVKQEIKKWIGLDVYVGSTAKECNESEPMTESMSIHVKRRLDDGEILDQLDTIIDWEVNSLTFNNPVEYVEEVCNTLTEHTLDYIWETTNLKVSLKEKDELYFYFVRKYHKYITKKYHDERNVNESKKKYIVTESQLKRLKEYFDPIHYLKKIMKDAPKYIRDPETLKYDVAFQKIVDVIFKYTMRHTPVDNLRGLKVSKVTPQGWGVDMGDDSKGSHTEWTIVLTSVLPKWFNPDDDTYKSQMEDFRKEFTSIANMMGLSSSSPLSQEGFPFDKVRFIISND